MCVAASRHIGVRLNLPLNARRPCAGHPATPTRRNVPASARLTRERSCLPIERDSKRSSAKLDGEEGGVNGQRKGFSPAQISSDAKSSLFRYLRSGSAGSGPSRTNQAI